MTNNSTELRRWLDSGARAVKRARGKLDAINVFPVADSDTGTNLYLTLTEGNKAVAKLPADASHREVVAAFARGCLLGARGNSGVIVSQYLSAFLKAIDARGGLSDAGATDIAESLTIAADAAYGAVGSPVEGTILTVARAAERGAHQAVTARASRETVAIAAVVAARSELARTNEILPSAREAGVVDAGAAGLVLQLEMLAETFAGPHALSAIDEVEWEVGERALNADAADPTPVTVPGAPTWNPWDATSTLDSAHDHAPTEGTVEVMFVAKADSHPATGESLRARLLEVGDSVAVGGADGLWQAHVHTDEPTLAIAVAVDSGAYQIIVRDIAAAHGADRSATGVVALTHCPGLAEDLALTGAVVLVVPDPASLRAEDLTRAVADASGVGSVVVAGSPERHAAARALAAASDGPRLTVLDAASEPQVVAALAAVAMLEPGGDLAAAMAQAVAACTSIPSSIDAIADDIERAVDPDTDVVTVILGKGVDASFGVVARAAARLAAPHADVTVYAGGQGAPGVIIGVEAAPSA